MEALIRSSSNMIRSNYRVIRVSSMACLALALYMTSAGSARSPCPKHPFTCWLSPKDVRDHSLATPRSPYMIKGEKGDQRQLGQSDYRSSSLLAVHGCKYVVHVGQAVRHLNCDKLAGTCSSHARCMCDASMSSCPAMRASIYKSSANDRERPRTCSSSSPLPFPSASPSASGSPNGGPS